MSIKIYANIQEAISDLIRNEERINSVIRSTKYSSYKDVVNYSAKGNTFRGLRNQKYEPSKTFRKWGLKRIDKFIRYTMIEKIKSQEVYDIFMDKENKNLQEFWFEENDPMIMYGQSRKLVNLLYGTIPYYTELKNDHRIKLINVCHIPLDEKVLISLKKILPDLKIPMSASMGFIKNDEVYYKIQNKIREIALLAKVPPFYYDRLIWYIQTYG